MISWKKVPDKNKEMLNKVLEAVPEAEKKMMFGCPVWFISGNMFVGAHQEDIFLRLAEPDREEILKQGEAKTFTPMPGRTMKEYVVIPPSIYESETNLLSY